MNSQKVEEYVLKPSEVLDVILQTADRVSLTEPVWAERVDAKKKRLSASGDDFPCSILSSFKDVAGDFQQADYELFAMLQPQNSRADDPITHITDCWDCAVQAAEKEAIANYRKHWREAGMVGKAPSLAVAYNRQFSGCVGGVLAAQLRLSDGTVKSIESEILEKAADHFLDTIDNFIPAIL